MKKISLVGVVFLLSSSTSFAMTSHRLDLGGAESTTIDVHMGNSYNVISNNGGISHKKASPPHKLTYRLNQIGEAKNAEYYVLGTVEVSDLNSGVSQSFNVSEHGAMVFDCTQGECTGVVERNYDNLVKELALYDIHKKTDECRSSILEQKQAEVILTKKMNLQSKLHYSIIKFNDGQYTMSSHVSFAQNHGEVDYNFHCVGKGDQDFDGILDGKDNCPFVANEDQLDANENGQGDACEPKSLSTEKLAGHSLSTHGNYTVVGHYGTQNIFEKTQDEWFKIGEIDGWGNTAMDDKHLVMAKSDGLRFFERNGANFNPTQEIPFTYHYSTPSHYGSSMALSGDTLVVGAYQYQQPNYGPLTGRIFVYKKTYGTWSLVQTIDGDYQLYGGGNFGKSLAFNGSLLFVGAPSAANIPSVDQQWTRGTITVFKKQADGSFSYLKNIHNPKPGREFPSGLASNAEHLVVGARDTSTGGSTDPAQNVNRSSVLVYDLNGDSIEVDFDIPRAHEHERGFGETVAISGNKIAVGGFRNGGGSVSLYQAAGGAWVKVGEVRPEIHHPERPHDRFGGKIALHGGNLVVGAVDGATDPSNPYANRGTTTFFELP